MMLLARLCPALTCSRSEAPPPPRQRIAGLQRLAARAAAPSPFLKFSLLSLSLSRSVAFLPHLYSPRSSVISAIHEQQLAGPTGAGMQLQFVSDR